MLMPLTDVETIVCFLIEFPAIVLVSRGLGLVKSNSESCTALESLFSGRNANYKMFHYMCH